MYINEVTAEPNLSMQPSDTKLPKYARRASRLPKCSPIKSISIRPKTAIDFEENQLDFPTRMKLKEKISELQQLNNELKFKLTTAETKLKARDGELLAAESVNKQMKQLLEKHINRDQELNSQIMNLEKKLSRASQQICELEEEKKQNSNERNEFQNLAHLTKELSENLAGKETQMKNLTGQLVEIQRSFDATSTRNRLLESQLEEVKKIEPMLDVRKNYINILEDKVRHLEELCSKMNEEICKLKSGISRLESFRLHSFLAVMGKETCSL